MSTWTYMIIEGQGHSLTLVQGHSDSTFSNIFSLEADKLIEAKFHVEPPRDGRMKMSTNGLCHMTKIAAMPIYGKKLKNFFSGTKMPMTLKLGMQHQSWVLLNLFNDVPRLTLTCFTARSNLVPYSFLWEKLKLWISFTEPVVVYDIKVGRCSHLNEYRSFMSTKGQGHSLSFVKISQIQYF